MYRLAKSLSVCLVLVLAVSILFCAAVPVGAEAVPQPSVPDFSVNYVDSSYRVSKTNPFTGALEVEQVLNASFVITIANQPFPYSDYQLFYNVRCRPHFEGDWKEAYPVANLTRSYEGGYVFTYALYIKHGVQQSNSSYTTIIFSVKTTSQTQGSGYDVYGVGYLGIPWGSKLDFQVEAQVGHPSSIWVGDDPVYPMMGGHQKPATAYDLSSEWSSTKTAAIGDTTVSALPSPAVPEFPVLAILPLFIAAPALIAVIYRKKSQLK